MPTASAPPQPPDKGAQPRESVLAEPLARLKANAEATLAALIAQDPLAIDIGGRVPYLPRMVLRTLADMKSQLNERSRTAIEDWQEREVARARELWSLMERNNEAFSASLPPNWKSPEVEFPDLAQLESLQLSEGLPLAWVPPNGVLRRLLEAETAESRRDIISAAADTILAACFAELERLTSTETREWRASAVEAGLVMSSGHWRAG